ncbi:ATP-binding protein [Methylocystis parvus]|uniref:histidine kinase n=1 Tax=Methylocystis parvus TaxID=134 RepID=A0A6B8M5D1_9HYPH|nr:ATP-binding protein [Methylocystis parvus]QGM99194.1 response regulator [Methylocystis parvus]WBK00427.1 ATP-binding protein [Methylocystis parvus OBBP]
MLSSISEWIFGVSGLEPHGYCLLWEPWLIWLYAISDGATALAYFFIPVTLIVVGRRRSDLVYRPMLMLFAAFILLCGTTHWLDLLTLWAPLYGLQGVVKAATALASVTTAAALWWMLPEFLALPSVAQLSEANAALLETEERLAHAQKMEAIGQLTGGIAHDFNNLLQVVVGSLSVIEHQVKLGRGNEIMPAVAAIKRATSNASSLIDRMLAFSRRQTLLPRVIEPDNLIRSMEEMLRRTLGPEIELDMRLGDGRRVVNCDPSQLESAVLNLAINARDAMPNGGALTICTADREIAANPRDPDLAPGAYVEIAVSDSGVGMSQEVLDRVFEPFFTTKSTGRGTGLGLSQLYGFVKQSGGFVKIESAPGEGATVRILLPAHEAPPIREMETETIDIYADSDCPLRLRRTLVVEDQVEVRSQIVACLEEMGGSVREAGDGTEGLRALQSGEIFDLLITDVGLPGLSGAQLAEAARAAYPKLPILIITGYAGKSLETVRMDSNMEILRKPFTLEELVARARGLLHQPATAG